MTQDTSSLSMYFHPVLAQEVLGGQSTSTPATQAPGGTIGPNGAPAGQAPAGGSNIFFFAIIMMVGMFLIMSMSGRKEKKKRAAMLNNLSKKDKIRTAGGIIGTIIEIKGKDKQEVLIETDRSSNTRLLLARSSITQVLESSNKPNDDKVESSDSSDSTDSSSITESVTA
jgi:preprotein translocase subunit YajC